MQLKHIHKFQIISSGIRPLPIFITLGLMVTYGMQTPIIYGIKNLSQDGMIIIILPILTNHRGKITAFL